MGVVGSIPIARTIFQLKFLQVANITNIYFLSPTVLTLLFSLSYSSALASVTVDQLKKDPIKSAIEIQPKEEDGKSASVLPLAGYNPTYQVFLGGGYFFKKVVNHITRYNNSVYVLVTQTKAIKFETNLRYHLSDKLEWVMRNELAKGFESNYGYGSETKARDRVDVPLWKDEFSLWVPYQVSKRLKIGPITEHMVRHTLHMTDIESFMSLLGLALTAINSFIIGKKYLILSILKYF